MKAYCSKMGHDNQEIQALCLNNECKRYICNKCLQKGNHHDHFHQIFFMQVSEKKEYLFQPDSLDNLIQYISDLSKQINKFLKEQYDFYSLIRQQNQVLIDFFLGMTNQSTTVTQTQICENLVQLKQLKEQKLIQKTRLKLKQFYEFFESQLKLKIERYRLIENTPNTFPNFQDPSPLLKIEFPIKLGAKTHLPRIINKQESQEQKY